MLLEMTKSSGRGGSWCLKLCPQEKEERKEGSWWKWRGQEGAWGWRWEGRNELGLHRGRRTGWSEGSFGKGRGLWLGAVSCVILWGPDWSRKVGCRKYHMSCQTSSDSHLLPSFPSHPYPRLVFCLGAHNSELQCTQMSAGWHRRLMSHTKCLRRALAWSQGTEALVASVWVILGQGLSPVTWVSPASDPALQGGFLFYLLGLRKDLGSRVSCCWSISPKPRVPGEEISVWWLYPGMANGKSE